MEAASSQAQRINQLDYEIEDLKKTSTPHVGSIKK